MNTNFFSFSFLNFLLLVCNNMIFGNEVRGGEEERNVGNKTAEVAEGMNNVVRDRRSFDYTFHLRQVGQITEIIDNDRRNFGRYGKHVKICTVCHHDLASLDRICRNSIINLKLEQKYDILYADGVPVERTKAYRILSKRSKILKESVVFARKCPTAPALYLTNGRSPRSVIVIMKRPMSRLRRFVHAHQIRPNYADIGI